MKKTILCAIVFATLIALITACSTNDSTNNPNQYSLPEGPYMARSTDWQIYADSQDLIEKADLVFIGKIVDISFHVLDIKTAQPVSEATADDQRYLYTVYEVEVITSYKGDTGQVVNVRIMGGMVDYRIEEQLEIMERNQAYGWQNGTIPVWENYQKVKCSIGESYLFTLYQPGEDAIPTILNLDQSIFALDDPSKKQSIGNTDKVYYTGDVDEYGQPLISVEDIVKEFGKEKWDTLYTQWENGDFNVETILD